MARKRTRRRVAVVTGSRAEYGLLRPVMRAVAARRDLELRVIACGSHLIGPASRQTVREVEREFPPPVLAAKVKMQGEKGRGKASVVGVIAERLRDSAAVGKGMLGFAEAYAELEPDWVVVLGDRIEAFAAAAAASVGGIAVAHIHGGDRAEGIADEAMRHAITKLAHVHFAATDASARRIVKMGEPKERVVVVGSPAVDGLEAMGGRTSSETVGLSPTAFEHLQAVVLLHPAGLGDRAERETATKLARGIAAYLKQHTLPTDGVLVLAPNHDAGRAAIVETWNKIVPTYGWVMAEHLPRETFVGVLKRLRERSGFLAGNSSAGLIECAALGVAALNVEPRQNGRERAQNVVDADAFDEARLAAGLRAVARRARHVRPSDRFGDGHAGERIAAALAAMGRLLDEPAFSRKLNVY